MVTGAWLAIEAANLRAGPIDHFRHVGEVNRSVGLGGDGGDFCLRAASSFFIEPPFLADAARAEIRRRVSTSSWFRTVNTTNKTVPAAISPSALYRSSAWSCDRSLREIIQGSSNTSLAVSKRTPCLRRFSRVLTGSNRTGTSCLPISIIQFVCTIVNTLRLFVETNGLSIEVAGRLLHCNARVS